jgi:cobalt-zinc-cadmium resistance protein CzcA
MELMAMDRELQMSKLELQLFLNAPFTPEPQGSSLKLVLPTCCIDEQHPELARILHQRDLTVAQVEVDKSRLLPEITLGYANQTLRDLSPGRFSSVTAGVGIPIFTKSQKAQIEASRVQEKVMDNALDQKRKQLEIAYQKAQNQVLMLESVINNYETKQLGELKVLEDTAIQQFNAGEINFLEWLMIVNRSLEIRAKYLESLDQLNLAIIQLNYLSSK